MDEEILRGIDERLAVLEDLVVQLAAKAWTPAALERMAADSESAGEERETATPMPFLLPARALKHHAELLRRAAAWARPRRSPP
jgi:hypothetical protein